MHFDYSPFLLNKMVHLHHALFAYNTHFTYGGPSFCNTTVLHQSVPSSVNGDTHMSTQLCNGTRVLVIDTSLSLIYLSDEELVHEAKRRRGDLQDMDSEEEELLPEEVTAALKVIRKFAQKYCTEIMFFLS